MPEEQLLTTDVALIRFGHDTNRISKRITLSTSILERTIENARIAVIYKHAKQPSMAYLVS